MLPPPPPTRDFFHSKYKLFDILKCKSCIKIFWKFPLYYGSARIFSGTLSPVLFPG